MSAPDQLSAEEGVAPEILATPGDVNPASEASGGDEVAEEGIAPEDLGGEHPAQSADAVDAEASANAEGSDTSD